MWNKRLGPLQIALLVLGIALCQTSLVRAQYCNATQAPDEFSACGQGALTEYTEARVPEGLVVDWAEDGLRNLTPYLDWIECPVNKDPDVSVTRVLTTCQSTLDSRDLFALVTSTVSCGGQDQNESEPMESKWILRINLITNEIDFENICTIK